MDNACEKVDMASTQVVSLMTDPLGGTGLVLSDGTNMLPSGGTAKFTIRHFQFVCCLSIKYIPLIPIIPGFILQHFIPNCPSYFNIQPYFIFESFIGSA